MPTSTERWAATEQGMGGAEPRLSGPVGTGGGTDHQQQPAPAVRVSALERARWRWLIAGPPTRAVVGQERWWTGLPVPHLSPAQEQSASAHEMTPSCPPRPVGRNAPGPVRLWTDCSPGGCFRPGPRVRSALRLRGRWEESSSSIEVRTGADVYKTYSCSQPPVAGPGRKKCPPSRESPTTRPPP